MSNDILDEQPSQVEVHGPELLTVSAELKRRGCIILGMSVACVSTYRLTLAWPQPKQPALIETERGA
jgi:hypothetical protein